MIVYELYDYFITLSLVIEIIPTGSAIQQITEVEIILLMPQKAARKKLTIRDEVNEIFAKYAIIGVVSIFFFALTPGVSNVVSTLYRITGLPMEKQWKTCIVDSFIQSIGWMMSYLFIRRSLNPENRGILLQKYGADTFYGGLAAGVSVILKKLLADRLK